MLTLRLLPLVLFWMLVAGCQCQLSGTPLDVMEKRFNPACWIVAWSDATAAEATPGTVTPAP